MAENQLYLYWRYYTKPYVSINQLSFRIIIIDQYVDQQFLQDFGQLLLQLSFLNMNYDLILSGQNQPIFLKQKDETLTIDLLDKILHALIGKCNQDFILVKEKAQNNNDFVLLFTKQLFEMSIICKIELQNEGLNTIILFQDQNHFNTIDIKNGQIINSSNNIFELLIQIQQQSSVLKQQMFYNHQEKEELKKKIFRLDYQIDQKEANSLRGLLEINKFTKYSLSSKGTTIDIKGIIKFFCTNGTARDILRRKNRGGKSLYLFEVVLDLSSMSKAILLEIVQPFLYQLIAICKECQIICNLAILNNALIIIKSNFSTTWTDYEYSLLTQHLIDNCDQVSTNSNVKVFQYILDQFEKFIHYKKFLIFINHSFYNYQYQELSQKINLAQQKQIKIVSLGVDIKKYINRSIEGVIQYSLCQSQNLYIILKKLFTKVLDFENLNQVFQFQQNINQYPRKLQLLKFSSTDIQINCYLNKYFNYRIDDIQDEGFERIPFFKVDPLLFHILMLENEIKRLQNLINRQPIEKQNK
ncbi:unnamed protein product [Paramecium pentaurelia]|uniref:Uncharacterized protein n=1 Tax=Paramecium pentaurelia TaxID=43138 RepID=A0A8S1YHH8_9CILI|nr:unnamed protein product [Paramecium pentaurelia]